MKEGEHMQRKEGVLIRECTLEVVGVEAQIIGGEPIPKAFCAVLEIEILDSSRL